MADENQNADETSSQNTDHNQGDASGADNTRSSTAPDADIVERLVKEKVEESIKTIKSKLDKAYESRDEALKRIAEFEKKERDAELKRLKDEGKEREAYELQLAQERAAREALEKQNTELTRDVEVRQALASIEFRNEKARQLAYSDIVGQLVRNEQGVWVHRSGVAIKDFIRVFAESEDNAFMLKPKVSSGSGSTSTSNKGASSGTTRKKSLFEMSQEEVLKLAQEGKLRG